MTHIISFIRRRSSYFGVELELPEVSVGRAPRFDNFWKVIYHSDGHLVSSSSSSHPKLAQCFTSTASGSARMRFGWASMPSSTLLMFGCVLIVGDDDLPG